MNIGERIKEARKNMKMTQEQLAEKVGVSFQTVSSWEKGDYLPAMDKLEILAASLAVTPTDLVSEKPISGPEWQLKDRMFSEDNMYRFIRTFASAAGCKNTMNALPYAKKMHEGQFRKGEGNIPYIIHPLNMACHALALGLNEDELIAAILLHDVCEDCCDEDGNPIDPKKLPVSETVQEAVRLVTKQKSYIEKEYYKALSKNRISVIIKVLDRCNNISMMAAGFTKEKMAKYIKETEEFIMPLLDILKKDYADTCYNAAFLIKYQMLSILENLKRLL